MWLGVWSTSDDLQHFTRTTIVTMRIIIATTTTTPPTVPPIIGPELMGELGGVARGVADEVTTIGSVEQTRTANSHMV